jgi:uncharacterized protein (DUF1330 family)
MTQIALYPTQEQIRQLLADPDDRPVVMINLLRFKTADGAPDGAPVGAVEYGRYAEKVVALVEAKGGRVIWSGSVDSQLIGDGGEGFHAVALVEYPSRKAFIEMTTDPSYEEISMHRSEGLEGQWLIATTTAPEHAT